MAASVEAVVAALRVALEEAQKSDEAIWKISAANRWISQLPGSWSGRWRKLMVPGTPKGDAPRQQFVGHVRAVIAYLETNRDHPPRASKWWPGRAGRNAPQAAKTPQPTATSAQAASRPVNLLRVRKPMPGVH